MDVNHAIELIEIALKDTNDYVKEYYDGNEAVVSNTKKYCCY